MNQRKHLPRITVDLSEDTCTLSRSRSSTLPQHSTVHCPGYRRRDTDSDRSHYTCTSVLAYSVPRSGSALHDGSAGPSRFVPPVFWFLRADDGTGRPEANESTDQGNPVVPLYRCTSRRCTEESSTRRRRRVLREAGGTDDRRAHACRGA